MTPALLSPVPYQKVVFGEAYSYSLGQHFSGATGFALAPGSPALQAGLSLSAGGVLSGTATAAAMDLAPVLRATNVASGLFIDVTLRVSVAQRPGNLPAPVMSQPDATTIRAAKPTIPANTPPISSIDIRFGPVTPLTVNNASTVFNCYAGGNNFDMQNLAAGTTRYATLRGQCDWGDGTKLVGSYSTNIGSSTLAGSNVAPTVTTPVTITPNVAQANSAFSIDKGAADGAPAPTFALTAATLDSGSGPVDVLASVTGNAAAGYSYTPPVAGTLSVTGTWTNAAGSVTSTATATVTAAATVPNAMTAPTVTPLSTTSVRVTPGTDNGNGGATVDTRQLDISLDGTSWTTIGDASAAIDVTGLTASAGGTTVYARNRAHNAVGWGAYSANGVGATTATGAGSLTLTDFARDKAIFDAGARQGLDYATIPIFGTGTLPGASIEARAYSVDDQGETSTQWIAIGTVSGGGTFAGSIPVLENRSYYKIQIRDAANPGTILQTANRFAVGHVFGRWGQSEDARQWDQGFSNSPVEPLITIREQVERLALKGMTGRRSTAALKVAGVDALPAGASITGRIITLTGTGTLRDWSFTDYEVQAADGADWLVVECEAYEVTNGLRNGFFTALCGGRLRLRDVTITGNSSFGGCGWALKEEEPNGQGKYGLIDALRVRATGLSTDFAKMCAGALRWCYGKWKKNLDGLCTPYNIATTYGVGDHVTNANGQVFKSKVAGNLGNQVPSNKTSNAFWQNQDPHVDPATVTASVNPLAPVRIEYCQWDMQELFPANGGTGGNNYVRVVANSNDTSLGPFGKVRVKHCIGKRPTNDGGTPLQVGSDWTASPSIEFLGNWLTPEINGSNRKYIYPLGSGQSNVIWAGNIDYLTGNPISTPANATTGTFTPETNDACCHHGIHTRPPTGGGGAPSIKEVTDAAPWTASFAAMSNVLMATRPGAFFMVIHHTVSGTSFNDALNDNTGNARQFVQDLALHNLVTMNGATKVNLACSSWFAAPGAYSTEYGEVLYQCMTGKKSSDGSSIGAAAPYTVVSGGVTFTVNHLWAELYGDYSYTKWGSYGPHRFEPAVNLSDATFDAANAVETNLDNKEDCRRSIRAMVASAAGQLVFAPVQSLSAVSYWSLASDRAHPNAFSDDGLPRKARLDAYAFLNLAGMTHWKVPKFDQATWTTTYADLKSSSGPVTTTRKARALAALTGQAHYTDVMGIQLNGFPSSHTATIVDNAGAAATAGSVRVQKLSGNFIDGDLINYGEGGASGCLIGASATDIDGGVWMNLPIVDVGGLWKLEGIPVDPLPDQTLMGNTLTSTPAPFSVAGGSRFRNPANFPSAQRQWTGQIDLALNRTGVTKCVYQIANLHLTLEVLNTRIPRVTLKDANSVTLLSNVSLPAQRVAWGARATILISVDFDAGTLWLSVAGRAPSALTFTPPSAGVGISSASRRSAFLATAATTSPGANNVGGKVWSLDEIYAAAGGAWPGSGTKPSGVPITGPAATANASSWKEGANVT